MCLTFRDIRYDTMLSGASRRGIALLALGWTTRLKLSDLCRVLHHLCRPSTPPPTPRTPRVAPRLACVGPSPCLPCCSVEPLPPDARAAGPPQPPSPLRGRVGECRSAVLRAATPAERPNRTARVGAARRGWPRSGVAWRSGACGAELGPGAGRAARGLGSIPFRCVSTVLVSERGECGV